MLGISSAASRERITISARLPGFETADEMRQAGRLRAAERHHLEDILGNGGVPCPAGELQREEAGVAGRALPRRVGAERHVDAALFHLRDPSVAAAAACRAKHTRADTRRWTVPT